MTEDELAKIPRYSITGQFPGLKQGAKVCYGASILWDEHRGRRAAGIALFLSALVEQFNIKPHILANDTGNRFAVRVGQAQLSEANAILLMKGEGQAWITDQTPVFAANGIRETTKMRPSLDEKVFGRWEDYRNSVDPEVRDEFQYTHDAYALLAKIDETQKLKLRLTAKGFMKRAVKRIKEQRSAERKRDNNQPLITREEIAEGIHLCEEFLIEENTVFTMVGRRFDALVYTGPLLLCQEEPARGEFNIPTDLSIDRLSDSLKDIMEPGHGAVETLRKALSGFDRLQWIHIRRNKSYTPFADIEGLEKARTNTKARHYKAESEIDLPETMLEIRKLQPVSEGIEAFNDILDGPKPESPTVLPKPIPPLRRKL